MISVKDLRKSFGKLNALDGISVDLYPGKSYALIGPNGSGKTTLIKCILGLVVPASGNIFFNGKSIIGQWDYRNRIGYMPQIGRYPDNMKIGQLFDMIRDFRDETSSVDEELFQKFGLNNMVNKSMRTLSGGTRQKVSAAIAFMFRPDVLILDEPTSGLDPLSVEILKEKIIDERNAGKLIIISSHIMNDLDELSTDVIYLFEGLIRYRGTVEGIKEDTGYDRLGKAISAIIKREEAEKSITV